MKDDLKFSFIIPFTTPHKNKVKRAEASIEAQDYKNVEVITVHDARRKGASWARNKGAETASGDVLFFLDADCVLSPGILRHLRAVWDEYPDVDFLYGKYRWFGDELEVYPSRAWNPYVLESMNYISTMSPMKREVWEKVKFREKLDYFQDWDFWLRAVRQGYKGHFIRDAVLFQTERPDEKSISGGQKKPYWERVRYIQDLNGIARKPICVTTFGAPYQAEYRAEVLGADYLGSNMESDLAWLPGMWGPHDYEMIYIMGFYPRALDAHMKMFEGMGEDCKMAIHWIGTDVYQLSTQHTFAALKALREDILSHIDVQWTTSDGLRHELAEMGVKAKTLIAPVEANRYPFLEKPPESFAVACYTSDTNPMHNEDFLQEVAKSLPHIKFFFFGRERKEVHKNIEYLGYVRDINEIIRETSLNLRMTIHDGMPQTALQWLMAGREVVCNSQVPGARYLHIWPNMDEYGAAKSMVMNEIVDAMKNPRPMAERREIRRQLAVLTDPADYRKKVYAVLENVVRAADKKSHDVARGNGSEHSEPVHP